VSMMTTNSSTTNSSIVIPSEPAIDMNDLHGFDEFLSEDPDVNHGVHLDRDQVNILRLLYSDDVTEFIQDQQLEADEDESETDFRLRAETEWMESLPRSSEFYVNLMAVSATEREGSTIHYTAGAESRGGVFQSNSIRDFLVGFAFGYFLGVIGIYFAIDQNNNNHMYKLGIISGVILSIIRDHYVMQYQYRRGVHGKHLRSGHPTTQVNAPPVIPGLPTESISAGPDLTATSVLSALQPGGATSIP